MALRPEDLDGEDLQGALSAGRWAGTVECEACQWVGRPQVDEVLHTGGQALVVYLQRTVVGEVGEWKRRDHTKSNGDLFFAGKTWRRRMLLCHIGETATVGPWVAVGLS